MPELSQRLQDALSGRYRIERELGRGGWATVFLAEDLRHHRRVAIKVLDPEIAAAIGPARFLREIEIVARLTHPHILPLFDSGEADGLLYFVMPYVTGESLRARLEREKQLPQEEALRIASEVADALEFAHRQGVVHRDIKPENILLESGHAVVADYGIARAIAASGPTRLTTSGVVVGTPTYMSPEQAGASKDLDGRSDVYNLGCVLYEMLAGQPPFTGPTFESLSYQHLNVVAHPVSALRSSVPAAVDRAIAKALAKAPADRYATAEEFGRVIAAAAAAITTATTVKVPRARSRWPAAAALVVVLALLYTGAAAWQQWWPFAEPSRPAPAKKDWILVAEFDGPPGDSTLAPAARSLLSAALDQSRLLATVPQDQIREALKAAGKPGNTRVDAEVAKELAYRSAVRAVLEGEMGRIGHGYSLVVRVVDADTSRVLVTERATAKDEDALIPTLGELAKQLRKGLGENQQALKATRAMGLVATPSFEAYKLYLQAQTVFRRETAIRKAMGLYRAALALDPDFAAAWAVLGYRYGDLGYPDSELVCIEEALRRPDRLSAGQRGILAIARARAEGDFAGAAAALDRMVAEDPTNLQALGSGTDALWAMGRFEEAFERNRRAMQLSPFGPSEAMRVNDTVNSILLGRFDEAREANRHQTGIGKGALRAQIELAASQPAAAESMSLASLDDPRLKGDYPEGFRGMLGVAQFARGAVAAANQALERAEAMCRDASDPAGAAFWHRWRIDYSALSNGTMPMPRDGRARDTTAATLLDRGLEAAITRDLTLARRCLEQARGRPRRELVRQGAAPSLLEARLETMEGRPADAVRLLRPLAVKRVEVGWPNGVGLTWVRWYLADAFERLDQPDSAATYLERSWDLPFVWLACAEKPWVHRRLALLYARMGRIPDAERHLAALERAWDRPDPKVLTVLDEVRVAVKSARGMAAPVR